MQWEVSALVRCQAFSCNKHCISADHSHAAWLWAVGKVCLYSADAWDYAWYCLARREKVFAFTSVFTTNILRMWLQECRKCCIGKDGATSPVYGHRHSGGRHGYNQPAVLVRCNQAGKASKGLCGFWKQPHGHCSSPQLQLQSRRLCRSA